MSYTITIKKTLSDEFLADVMCTMIESGYDSIFHWEGLNLKTLDRDENGYPVWIVLECDSPYLELKRHSVSISRDNTAKAIERILNGDVPLGYPREYIQRAVAEDDAGDIDATAADCIAQVIAFNEVVYG
jgi:hypothetical protein